MIIYQSLWNELSSNIKSIVRNNMLVNYNISISKNKPESVFILDNNEDINYIEEKYKELNSNSTTFYTFHSNNLPDNVISNISEFTEWGSFIFIVAFNGKIQYLDFQI